MAVMTPNHLFKKRQRHQTGHLFKKSGSWYLRYYYTTSDGTRKQKAERLAEIDEKHHSEKCRAVRLLVDAKLLEVNSGSATIASATVAAFWTATYLPWAKDNLRRSTWRNYQHLWEKHLKDHFGARTLSEYESGDATEFLTDLAKTLSRNSVNHARSLMSGIFSHACARRKVKTNPMHEAKILVRAKAPALMPHYTLEELEDLITALVARVDCQLILALAGFLGLRPSEIEGLKWEDFDANFVHIRRGSVRGIIGPLKTPESAASIPLIDQVQIPLKLWRAKSGSPTSGWLFPNRSGDRPINLRDLQRKVIRPAVEKAKLTWKTLYAGRRGAATALVGLTGNLVAAQELLRHKSLTTTAMFYKKQTSQSLMDGLKLLQEAAQGDDSKAVEGQKE
jgi:integrase